MNTLDVIDVTNHEQVARHLLEAGAKVDAQNNKGWTAIMYCAQNDHADVRAYPLVIAFIIHHTICFMDASDA